MTFEKRWITAGKPFSRRVFLAEGTRLSALGSVGGLVAALGFPMMAQAKGWGDFSLTHQTGGYGTVKQLKGRATAAGRKLSVGSRVESGEEIQVARNGQMILSLSDNTIMRINGNTKLKLGISQRRSGFFQLLAGSLLTVMPKGNKYLVNLPTAVVGIKGTVFYQQIFHPEETTAIGMEERRYTIPKGVREYFCLCNGAVDFLDSGAKDVFFSDEAEHHNSYYLNPNLPNPLVKAPMVNHADSEIRDLIKLQDGSKHSTDFLDAYTASYSGYGQLGDY